MIGFLDFFFKCLYRDDDQGEDLHNDPAQYVTPQLFI